MNNKGVSVIISTYNGRARLAKTMEHLVNQIFTCPYEIILVDNASTDGTKTFCDNWWNTNGNKFISYKSFFQPIPGKSYAQEMGYSEATYEYLIVCDDDNLFNEDYVQLSFQIMESNISIGALGGWCDAMFEGDKPEWFDAYRKYFAVGKQSDDSGDITNKKGCLYGAGMVIRKSHWLQLNETEFIPLLTCRKGDSLSSGGDTEYCYALRLLGYKIWYDERLYFKHFMVRGRMKMNYITRVRKAISNSNFVVSVYTDELNNKLVTKNTFSKKLMEEIRKKIVKQTYKRIFGSFEEKELAKEYFRELHILAFSYEDYHKNRESIKNWLPSE